MFPEQKKGYKKDQQTKDECKYTLHELMTQNIKQQFRKRNYS
ncbi:hypothetical protein Q3A68_10580 [Mucilaginibacter sp. BT774]|nr:hypothetical protein [Mucilaginibacter sp. BT774]